MMEQDSWDEPTRPVPTAPAIPWATQTRRLVVRQWQPEPLAKPSVDPEFPQLSAVERSAEVLSYSCRAFEYWLSPGGFLREWFKFNLRLAFALAVPALLVAPLVTLALRQFDAWIGLITKTTSNFVLVPLSVLLVVGLVAGLVSIARSILSMRTHRRRDPYNNY